MVWMRTETSSYCGQRNDDCRHTVPELEVHRSSSGYAWIQCLEIASSTYSDKLIALFDAVFSYPKVSTISLFELHSWRKLGHIIYFLIRVVAAQTYKLVRIELSWHSKHWQLWPHWVSTIHGQAEVTCYLAESLNTICLLRFSLWSCRSIDRDWTCRSYFVISEHRSKHTTLSILSLVGLLIGLVSAFIVKLYRETFLQWTSWYGADSSRHFSGSLHIEIKHTMIYQQRLSGISRLLL